MMGKPDIGWGKTICITCPALSVSLALATFPTEVGKDYNVIVSLLEKNGNRDGKKRRDFLWRKGGSC